MAGIPQIGFVRNGLTYDNNTNTFFNWPGSRSGTENQAKIPRRIAGTVSLLTCTIKSNSAGNTANYRTRVNNANGNCLVAVSVGSTGIFQDATNSDTLASGDTFDINLNEAAAGGSTFSTVTNVSYLFSASSDSAIKYINAGEGTISHNNNTTYWSITGGQNDSQAGTTESNAQTKMQTGGTLKNLYTYIPSNSRTVTDTIRTRINGANGNCSVSITSGATGAFEDTSNTDTVASGDTINYAYVWGANGNFTSVNFIACDFSTTDSSSMLISQFTGALTVNANLTRYYGVMGDGGDSYSTESDVKTYALVASTLSKLAINVTANTVSATSTCRLRVNGANGNSAASITASTTGYYIDNSNSDTVAAGDSINYSVTTGATGTSMSFRYIAMKIAVGGGGGGVVKTWDSIAWASVKNWGGIANASVKKLDELASQ